jgi:hypothetical protein
LNWGRGFELFDNFDGGFERPEFFLNASTFSSEIITSLAVLGALGGDLAFTTILARLDSVEVAVIESGFVVNFRNDNDTTVRENDRFGEGLGRLGGKAVGGKGKILVVFRVRVLVSITAECSLSQEVALFG